MQAPFWRDEPLSRAEDDLLSALYRAHAASVERNNISSVTAVNVAAGSMSYANAIASAILSTGNGIHAPLELTIQLLTDEDPVAEARRILDEGCKLPGWGNSFIKGGPDPLWGHVDNLLRDGFNPIWRTISGITAAASARGKNIHPNPSTYTAAAAIVLRIPPRLSPFLFVMGRLEGWSKLIAPHLP
jgi:citrate synthase